MSQSDSDQTNIVPAQFSERSMIKKIFISPDEKRLRAGWRLLVHLLFILIASVLFALPISIASEFISFNVNILLQLTSGLAIVVGTWAARKWIDKRSFSSLGLKIDQDWWKDLLVGIAIAAVLHALIFAAHLGTGWLTFSGFAWQTIPIEQVVLNTLGIAAVFLAVGFYEELMSRGYHLQNLEDGLNTGWAVFLSSAVFGFLHILNPGATWISSLGILAAGVFLAYPYLRTRQLWMSVGLHIGWNFFLGPVFGFPVSGLETPRLILHEVTGPAWFTGGAFGPEAGMSSIFAMLIGAVLVYYYTQNRLSNNIEEQAK